jgi:hypothetical protein
MLELAETETVVPCFFEPAERGASCAVSRYRLLVSGLAATSRRNQDVEPEPALQRQIDSWRI